MPRLLGSIISVSAILDRPVKPGDDDWIQTATAQSMLRRHCERKRSNRCSNKKVDCFVAEPVIGRAFARPVGSLAQTLRVCRRQ